MKKNFDSMNIHKEGKGILTKLFAVIMMFNAAAFLFFWDDNSSKVLVFCCFTLVIFLFFLNFFRNPNRIFSGFEEGMIVAPADGTIVVIEPTVEDEYLNEKRMQVSIFMSVFNVHANWTPCDGKVKLVRHHDGRFKAAWLPKASTENERSTIVITASTGQDILVRQVAGAMARRIVTYFNEGDNCEIDEHMGFIKFGSRVDIYLPVGTKVNVELGQRTTGNETVIARL